MCRCIIKTKINTFVTKLCYGNYVAFSSPVKIEIINKVT